MLLAGSSPLAVILLPPLLLVFGGTFGAAVAGSTIDDLSRLRQWTQLALTPERVAKMTARIAVVVDLPVEPRREGLLSLDRQLGNVRDPFLRRGLRLAVDGTDPDQLRSSLEGEIAARRTEEKVAAMFFARMPGYAPTIGIIGSVFRIIHVLAVLSDTAALGPLIATAFVATLWGVLSANFLWLPMSHRIMRTSDLRTAQLELLLTGIAEIQAGTSPRALRQRLPSLLPPDEAAAARAAA